MTIKEIASLAGVSISTVSKIVNSKDDNINPSTRNRVLSIVKEYNYTPYGAFKHDSEAKTFIIGVLLRDAPQTNQLLNGIIDTAQQNGYSIMVYDSGANRSKELKHITSLCKNNVDAVIWEPVDENSCESSRYFSELGIEICYINAEFSLASHCIDYTQMGYCATQVLIDYRHNRLGCLVKDNSLRSALMLKGFKKCLYDNQIPYSDKMQLTVGQGNWYSGVLSHTLTGIVSSHYNSSLILLEQLDKLKYRVPYDLSLVSLRDDVREAIQFPKISSFKIPYQEFGCFVCERIIEKCEKREAPVQDFTTICQLENTLSLDMPRSYHTKKIVVVGSINIDVTLNVEELPLPGKTVITNRHSIMPGGKGANQAVGVAKLGNEVALIGKVGNDYDSALIYSSMEDHHVDITGITRDLHQHTGKAYIHVQNDGESTITILTGANQSLTPDNIRFNKRIFEHAGYCLLQTEVPEESIEEAARLAHTHGAQNILKPAAMNHIRDSLMQHIDIFIPNQKEAQILCPHHSPLEKQAQYFMDKGVEVVIITLGQSGCFLKTQEYSKYFPAASFTAADTTGAADAFIAALAVYLLSGSPLEKAIRIATYAAGFCISRQGVIPALIDRNSLETYINTIEQNLLQ